MNIAEFINAWIARLVPSSGVVPNMVYELASCDEGAHLLERAYDLLFEDTLAGWSSGIPPAL